MSKFSVGLVYVKIIICHLEAASSWLSGSPVFGHSEGHKDDGMRRDDHSAFSVIDFVHVSNTD